MNHPVVGFKNVSLPRHKAIVQRPALGCFWRFCLFFLRSSSFKILLALLHSSCSIAHRPVEQPRKRLTKPWKWPNAVLCTLTLCGATLSCVRVTSSLWSNNNLFSSGFPQLTNKCKCSMTQNEGNLTSEERFMLGQGAPQYVLWGASLWYVRVTSCLWCNYVHWGLLSTCRSVPVLAGWGENVLTNKMY